MARRLAHVAVLLALVAAPALARGGEPAEVAAHLRTLPQGAELLGRAAPAEAVGVVIGFPWRDRRELERFLRAVRDPQAPEYGQYLSAAEFRRRFAPRAREVAATARYLRRAGLTVREVSRSRALLLAAGPAARVEQAFATAVVEVRAQGRRQVMAAVAPLLPIELSGEVLALGSADELRPLADDGMRMVPAEMPFDPAGIAGVYGFDRLHAAGRRGEDARHSTIAVATAFAYDPADVEEFWRETGVERPADRSEQVVVTGALDPAPPPASDTLESTLDVEWAGALAPQARVLAYVGTDASSTTFLRIYDRAVSDNRAAVLTTSWGRCEQDYPAAYLAQAGAIFERAAAQGITVIAAAGDRGAYECGGDTPSASFPASHPYVLAIGGTSLAPRDGGLEETVWPGSGGATSARFAAPPWQMQPGTARVMSDVAVNADPGSGYLVRHGGSWLQVGGTSVGAPVWAALVAIANQARAAADRPALGLAAPPLCELAHAAALDPPPLMDIVAGSNGLGAAPGWDFPTGWGTPNGDALVDALAAWTPPSDGAGGVMDVIALRAADEAGAGAVRLRVRRRCLSSGVTVHLRGVDAGTYALVVDGEPVASIDTDRDGDAIAVVPGVDVRGRRIQLVDGDGVVRFADTAPVVEDPTTLTAQAAMVNTGMAPAALGTVSYRAAGGREELGLRLEGLPAGTYEIRLGSDRLGTVAVAAGRLAEVHYDSLGLSGPPLAASPLCTPVLVLRDGAAYLRTVADALSPGACRG